MARRVTRWARGYGHASLTQWAAALIAEWSWLGTFGDLRVGWFHQAGCPRHLAGSRWMYRHRCGCLPDLIALLSPGSLDERRVYLIRSGVPVCPPPIDQLERPQ